MVNNFSIKELITSNTAERRCIDNNPPEDVINNLNRLIDTLESIRRLLGNKPIIVTSGYRSPTLNNIVGGSKSSSHMKGLAADIKVIGLKPRDVAIMISSSISILGLDQVIYEGSWVHVSIPEEGKEPRLQVLSAVFYEGNAIYSRGIV